MRKCALINTLHLLMRAINPGLVTLKEIPLSFSRTLFSFRARRPSFSFIVRLAKRWAIHSLQSLPSESLITSAQPIHCPLYSIHYYTPVFPPPPSHASQTKIFFFFQVHNRQSYIYCGRWILTHTSPKRRLTDQQDSSGWMDFIK